MSLNKDPSLAYKHIKLYTDYDLDYYDSLLGKEPPEVPKSQGSKSLKNSTNSLEPVLKQNGVSESDSGTVASSNVRRKYPYLQYKPCVSFDTVPISSPSKDSLIEREYPSYDFPGVQIPPELRTMDEWYDTESGYATNDNNGYFIHNNYLVSDFPFDLINNGNDNNNIINSNNINNRGRDRDKNGNSNNNNNSNNNHNNNNNNNNNSNNISSSMRRNRASSPTRIKSHNALKQMQNTFKVSVNGKIVREDYPSRPTVDNDAIVINRAYGQWNTLWNKRRLQIDDRLLNKTQFFKYSNILFPELNKDKKKNLDEDQLNLSNGSNKEWELLTRRQKKRWLIMNEVVGYPTGPKTILCHISGRKHTWVGLDYTIMKLAQDTDHIVVVANLCKLRQWANSNNNYTSSSNFKTRSQNHYHSHHYHNHNNGHATTTRSNRHHKRQSSCTLSISDLNTRSKSMSRDENVDSFSNKLTDDDKIGTKLTKTKSMDPDLASLRSYMSGTDSDYDSEEEDDGIDPQWAYGYDRQSITDKLNDILLYISVLLSKHPKSIKVTVEIVIGKSVNILNEMVNVYMPDLFVMAKKKVTSEVRWHSVHLTDKFLKHSPVPVCVVFVKPMYQFEIDLANEFSNVPTINDNDNDNDNKTKTIKTGDDLSSDRSKYLLQQLDKWIVKSIESGSKIARPQAKPKVMKSMIEIALANDKDKNKNRHRKTRSSSSHDMSTRTTKTRTPTASPLRREISSHGGDKLSSSSSTTTLGVPLTKTRTVSTVRPVKNWGTDKNSLRRIKSSTPDNVSKSHSHSSNSGSGGGFLSSLFKKRW